MCARVDVVGPYCDHFTDATAGVEHEAQEREIAREQGGSPRIALLYADHYATPESVFAALRPAEVEALMPARGDQALALERAGFTDVELRYEEGNMALWRGTNR